MSADEQELIEPEQAVPDAESGGDTIATDAHVKPIRTLWLLGASHAVNHAQAAVLPLIYLAVIPEFQISVATIAFLSAAGSFASGIVQLSYAVITRYVSRRAILTVGGLVFGTGMVAQALANGFATFSIANIASRIGGSPQHPVGNALLAEQFPRHRRGFAISSHIAGGNLGTVAVPLLGAWLIAGIGWRWTVVLFGLPAIVIALAVFLLVRESGADRAAARAHGSLRRAFGDIRRDRSVLLIYLSSMLGGGGRGLGVLNLLVPLFLRLVVGIDTTTVALMYTVLVFGSVPGPVIAGWLSDRMGRKPLIIGAYVGGSAALVLFVLAGTNLALLWLAVALLGTFNFVESPQLQALLSDVTSPALRDVSFALYFTLAFVSGSLWVALYGVVINVLGDPLGLPLSFTIMAAAFVAAALVVLPIRLDPPRETASR